MMWKAVFHIDEMEKWDLLLGNISNFLNGLHDDYLLHVVINAAAVSALLDEAYQEKISGLVQQQVCFECCQIALQGNGIDASYLPQGVHVVPSGIQRLIELQQRGFAYIKP